MQGRDISEGAEGECGIAGEREDVGTFPAGDLKGIRVIAEAGDPVDTDGVVV